MNTIPVLALVDSRLRTDVIMIRLRRVGIACRKISVVFPRRFTPNAVACWLRILQNSVPRGDGEPLMATGPLGVEFSRAANGTPIASLIEKAGFARDVAVAAGQLLESGNTLVCVHAEGDEEVSLAWQIFRHSQVDRIAVGESGPAEPLFAPPWSTAAA